MRRAGHVVLRTQLMEAAWGFDYGIGENSLDVSISSLRNKLSVPEHPQLIRTIRGRGYRMMSKET
jgi:DNA-binding response OmpR family regulator